jgi:hypothetical protein
MAAWREKAQETFPEFADQLDELDTLYLLWFELLDAFRVAYDPPINESLIKRV